jgi:hypothetical protein
LDQICKPISIGAHLDKSISIKGKHVALRGL